ncbi:MAG: hypothetical protein QM767_12460 [Anaeromyxobacter sp.]
MESKGKRLGAVAALAVVLTACGGGGGGGGGPIEATFSPDSITREFYEDDGSKGFGTRVTLSPNPGSAAGVLIEDPANVLENNTYVNDLGFGHYYLAMNLRYGIPDGHYVGALTFHICRNESCSSEYELSASTMSYDFLVKPVPDDLALLEADFTSDGVQIQPTRVAGYGSRRIYEVAVGSGDVLEIIPELPFERFQWSPDWSCDVDVTAPQPDRLRVVTTVPASETSCTSDVSAWTADGRHIELTVVVTP